MWHGFVRAPPAEAKHKPSFFRSAGPLRGVKRDLYEGGIRVPMIVRCPGRVPAGRVSNEVWTHWDVLPTLAEIAGQEIRRPIDGVSVLSALTGGSAAPRISLLGLRPHPRPVQAGRPDRRLERRAQRRGPAH